LRLDDTGAQLGPDVVLRHRHIDGRCLYKGRMDEANDRCVARLVDRREDREGRCIFTR